MDTIFSIIHLVWQISSKKKKWASDRYHIGSVFLLISCWLRIFERLDREANCYLAFWHLSHIVNIIGSVFLLILCWWRIFERLVAQGQYLRGKLLRGKFIGMIPTHIICMAFKELRKKSITCFSVYYFNDPNTDHLCGI